MFREIKLNVSYCPGGFISTATWKASRRGNVKLLRKIIRFGRSLEIAEFHSGKTALHLSVENRHLECSILLLKNGLNVHVRDNFGRHALFYAAENDDVRMARQLVLHGLNCNAQDNNGMTSVMVAVHKGSSGNQNSFLKCIYF